MGGVFGGLADDPTQNAHYEMTYILSTSFLSIHEAIELDNFGRYQTSR